MLGRPVDELQPPIAGDAVVDMDNQVAFIQIEEAVDGPALVPPPGDRAADIGAGEELMVGDHQGGGIDQVKARPDPSQGAMEAPLLCQGRVAEDLTQALDLGGVVAGDEHAVTGRGAVELGLHPGQLSREAFDALDPKMARRLQRVGRQGRDRDRREADQPLEGALHRVEPARVIDPAQVMPALLMEVAGLDQGHPRALGEIARRRAEVLEAPLVIARWDRQRHVVPAIE